MDLHALSGREHPRREGLQTIRALFNADPTMVVIFSQSLTINDSLTGLRAIRAEILRGWLVKSKGFDSDMGIPIAAGMFFRGEIVPSAGFRS